jgi:small neutral amino acid transporter SnatA (MarC family)
VVILDAISIHMHSLKVAGGIILFLFGLQLNRLMVDG